MCKRDRFATIFRRWIWYYKYFIGLLPREGGRGQAPCARSRGRGSALVVRRTRAEPEVGTILLRECQWYVFPHRDDFFLFNVTRPPQTEQSTGCRFLKDRYLHFAHTYQMIVILTLQWWMGKTDVNGSIQLSTTHVGVEWIKHYSSIVLQN